MKKPSQSQLKTIIEICINLGSISFGSIAVPIIFDRDVNLMLLFGIEWTLVFWFLAINISGKIKR